MISPPWWSRVRVFESANLPVATVSIPVSPWVTEELAKIAQNPIGNLISVPFQENAFLNTGTDVRGAPQIAGQIGIGEKTVKVHRARVMSKTGARSVPELTQLALRVGMQSGPPVPIGGSAALNRPSVEVTGNRYAGLA